MRTKSGSIYQDKKTGRYRAMLSTSAGRPSKYFDTKQEAADWLAKQQNAILTGTYVEPSAITLGGWLTTWLRDYKKDSISQRTFELYVDLAGKCKDIAHFKLQQVSAPLIQEFYRQLSDNGLGVPSIRKLHKVLKASFKKALQIGIVPRNIMDAVEPPKKPKQEEIQTFSRDEISKILEASREYCKGRYYPMILLAVTTGMRIGEVLAIRWCDISVKNHEVRVAQNLQVTKAKGIVFNPPKTAAGRRTISVPEITISQLMAIKRTRNVESINGLVFLTANTHNPYEPHNIRKAWKTIVKNADVPYRKFHTLRHTHATDLLADGVPIVEVSRRLGHAQVSHTLNIYAHAIPRYDKEIATKVAQLYLAN